MTRISDQVCVVYSESECIEIYSLDNTCSPLCFITLADKIREACTLTFACCTARVICPLPENCNSTYEIRSYGKISLGRMITWVSIYFIQKLGQGD